MKRIVILTALAGGLFFGACNKQKPEKAAGATNLPGDNLDLYAVLDIFKTSKTLEGFEKSLNDKSRKINNLDLNGDGKVDYIKVIDNKDGDDHAITLRVPISKTESQDVAVIEVEKTGDKKANVQIIGDETLYGKDYVIEPKDKTDQSGFVFATVAINVWDWPVVTYIYSPAYVVYVSPWDYDYYPVWWEPWEPVTYDVYYPVVYSYHSYYYPVGHPRFEHANQIYIDHRMSSSYVEHERFNYRNQPKEAPRYSPDRGAAPRGNQNNYSPAKGNEGGKNPPRAGERIPQPGPSHGNRTENNSGASHKSTAPVQHNMPQPGNQSVPHSNERNSMPHNNMPSERTMPQQQHSMPQQQHNNMPQQQHNMPMPQQHNMPRPQGGRPR